LLGHRKLLVLYHLRWVQQCALICKSPNHGRLILVSVNSLHHTINNIALHHEIIVFHHLRSLLKLLYHLWLLHWVTLWKKLRYKFRFINQITSQNLWIFNFNLWITENVVIVVYIFYYFYRLSFLFWFWRSCSSLLYTLKILNTVCKRISRV
jgi:hypothetical protein